MDVLELFLVIVDMLLLTVLSGLVCLTVYKWQKRVSGNEQKFGRFQSRQQNGLILLDNDGTPLRCPVCLLTITDNDTVENTPCCQTPCHSDHLREFIHVKGKCPYCGTALVVCRFTDQLGE